MPSLISSLHDRDALGMHVERAGERRWIRPGRLASEELQGETVPGELTPRRIPRLREPSEQSEPDAGVPVERGLHFGSLQDGIDERMPGARAGMIAPGPAEDANDTPLSRPLTGGRRGR